MISWFYKKEGVGLNSSEVEYMATSSACCEAIWVCILILELTDQLLEPTVVYYDNQSCINLSKYPIFHDHSKYIDIPYHFFRD
jgi:hypothetical protein